MTHPHPEDSPESERVPSHPPRPVAVPDLGAETTPETKENVVALRIDNEHLEALLRICRHEGISKQNTLKRLIRIADQAISGEMSPFKTIDQALFKRRAG